MLEAVSCLLAHIRGDYFMERREVTITFKSHMYDTDEQIDISAKGTYFRKDDKHCVMYTETVDGGPDVRNILKFDAESLDVSKISITRTNMFYKAGHIHEDVYRTPLGEYDMRIQTEEYALFDTGHSIDIIIVYNLELGGAHISKCRVEIKVV